jgi:hypothetical protein
VAAGSARSGAARQSELDAFFWLPDEMAPHPSPKATPHPGGPSNLATPKAKTTCASRAVGTKSRDCGTPAAKLGTRWRSLALLARRPALMLDGVLEAGAPPLDRRSQLPQSGKSTTAVCSGGLMSIQGVVPNVSNAQIADILRRCSPGRVNYLVLGSVKEPDPRFALFTLMRRPARRVRSRQASGVKQPTCLWR